MRVPEYPQFHPPDFLPISYLGIFLFGAKWYNNEDGPLEDSCFLSAKNDEVNTKYRYLANMYFVVSY